MDSSRVATTGSDNPGVDKLHQRGGAAVLAVFLG